MSIDSLVSQLKLAKISSQTARKLTLDQKNKFLFELSKRLLNRKSELLAENQKDIEAFKGSPKFSTVLLDRLQLTESRIQSMAESISVIRSFEDPVGKIVQNRELANGLRLELVRDHFGVIFFIFEARPNVITEAFSLAFKSGNAIIFRNGREAKNSSTFLYELIKETLGSCGLDKNILTGLIDSSYEDAKWVMQQEKWIDLVIPRGGEKLIESVKQNSRVPVIQNDRGLCHLFVDKAADIEMALKILENGKTQRPSVCNSLETVLVHEQIAERFLQPAFSRLQAFDVQWHVCEKSMKVLGSQKKIGPASAKNFATEYGTLELNCKIVPDLSSALQHIAEFGSRHSECIVTNNIETAKRFQFEVDAAVAYWNASTRFTDGFEFGLGGEIGISTQKLHVRGPVGLEALTTSRWIVSGTGQVRK